MNPGTKNFSEEFSNLYLDKKSADVTIVVDDYALPAHSYVLAQRCSYFAAMLKSGMIESTSKRIEIRETSLDGFKLVLQWIYTGTVEFKSIDSTFDAIRLAQMYVLEQEFENLAVDFLKKICSVDNACFILNGTVLLSLENLTDFTINVVKRYPCEVLKHESFKQLSLDALIEILTRVVFRASDIDVFHAVVRWMVAHPSKATSFSDLLENVPLDFLTIKDMVAFPSNVQDAVVHLMRQNKITGRSYRLKGKNVVASQYGGEVITANETSFFKEKTTENIQRNTSKSSENGNLNHFENPFSRSWFYLFQFLQMLLYLLKFILMPLSYLGYLEFIPLSILAAIYTLIGVSEDRITKTRGRSYLERDVRNLKHLIGTYNNGILIDLGHRFELNYFKMQLVGTFSYRIYVSEDNIYWNRVVDRSKYSDYGLQELYFEPRCVRFIRIRGTAPINDTFKISSFEAFYKL